MPTPDNTSTNHIGASYQAIRSLLSKRFSGVLAVPKVVSKSMKVKTMSRETMCSYSVGGREVIEAPARHDGRYLGKGGLVGGNNT
jgi:hypothetical protein